jgi:hypothetical protein
MSNFEDYNMKIDVIKTIPDDQIKVPNSIPVKIYIQEAEYLYAWCQDDKEELKLKGLDWTLVEDLPVRCGALRVAESKWRQAFTHLKEAVDLIRQCGQYAFWRNAGRLKGYRSNYLRKVRLKHLERKTKAGTGNKTVKVAM